MTVPRGFALDRKESNAAGAALGCRIGGVALVLLLAVLCSRDIMRVWAGRGLIWRKANGNEARSRGHLSGLAAEAATEWGPITARPTPAR